MKKAKTVFIKTFGCQMNARDSEFVTGILLDNGFRRAETSENADVIIFNSCSVRKHAEDRLFSNIGDLRKLKEKKPGLVIGLMGCTAQRYKDKAFGRAPLLDFICGTGDESGLPQIIGGILEDRCRVVSVGKVNEKKPEMAPLYRDGKFKAFVSIGEGCNNFCSYCIVPYVRGRERSRDIGDIVREVKDLAARGFKEITLLGQNVNSYRGLACSVERMAYRKKQKPNAKTPDFIRLLEKLNGIEGVERIRFMTSHPKDASTELFKAMRDLDNVCEHLHLPLQSGSDRILKLMNRKYTSTGYRKLADAFRKILPGGSITTDLILGFPTETDREFKRTLSVMDEVRFDSAFTFTYSPRPPAKSCKLKDNISDEVKGKRLKTIMDLQCKIAEGKNNALIGNTVEILVDGYAGKDPRRLTGRTRTNKVAVFGGSAKLVGKMVNVKIESVTAYALKGNIV